MVRTVEYFAPHFFDYQLYDVRSPAEYAQGHIPGAINLPLFSNDERAEIGTIYKQVGKQEAILRGLEIVGHKMRNFAATVLANRNNKKVMVHCWRGGMRSASMAWLLQTTGVETDTLLGGYRSFRKYCASQFAVLKLVVLGGMTGSGKTEILSNLSNFGEQIIDLEQIANHRGSAFGALGFGQQPSTEQFANNLFSILVQLDLSKPIWIEDESNSIGRVFLPDTLWNNKLKSPKIILSIDEQIRSQRVLREYGVFDKDLLKQSVFHIQKRLGGVNTKLCIDAIEQGDLQIVAAIALKYYDKAYSFSIENGNAQLTHFFTPQNQSDCSEIAKQLIDFKDRLIVDG